MNSPIEKTGQEKLKRHFTNMIIHLASKQAYEKVFNFISHEGHTNQSTEQDLERGENTKRGKDIQQVNSSILLAGV